MANAKDLNENQYNDIRTIAHSYGMSVGGYQTNNGYVLYTSERVCYGKTYSGLITDLHAAGRDCQKRIKRTLNRQSHG